MKKIEMIEEIMARVKAGENVEFPEYPEITCSMFWAYKKSAKMGMNHVDFNDVIWENETEKIVNCLRKAGHEFFTVSSTYSSLTEILMSFTNLGCKVEGMMMVPKDGYVVEVVPAIIIKL